MIAALLACSGPTPEAEETGTAEVVETEPAWEPVSIDAEEWPQELLSETNLLRWDGSEITYNDGVVPYTLNTPLFSDFALKDRAIWMPDGVPEGWEDAGIDAMPVGTVILKSFLFAADLRVPQADLQLIETRMLIRSSEGWSAWPYLWRTDGSEADRHVSGEVQTIDFIDPYGAQRTAQYLVPQRNQCVDCHDQYDDDGEQVLQPIGPTIHNLDSAVDWAAVEASGVASMSSSEVVVAARDYLHTNCAHCHSPDGIEGVTSQFFLNHDNDDLFHLGVCKRPGSAGEGGKNREFDIVPGDPEQSILWYRMATEDVGAMMPDIGRSLAHDTAVELIWRWIEEMEPEPCE